jgi:hypothetical protein
MAAVSRQGNDLRQSVAEAAVFTQHLSKVLLAMLGKSRRIFEPYCADITGVIRRMKCGE